MKTKILEALKTRYKNLGVGEKVLESFSELLEITVKEEADIETAVAGVEKQLKAIQGDSDKLRAEKANAEKASNELKEQIKKLSASGAEEPTVPSKTSESGQNPEYAKLLELMTGLQSQVQGLQTAKLSDTRKVQLDAVLKSARPIMQKAFKEKDLTTFKTDEEFATWLAGVDTDVKEDIADLQKKGLVIDSPVGGSGIPKPEKTTEVTEDELDKAARLLKI